MSAPVFDIIFRGVRKGFDPAQVKVQFASLFKLNAAKVERIFKTKNVVLKHRANERLANIFVVRLLAIGVVTEKCSIEPIISRALYSQDSGEVSTDASAMHQPVDFLYGEHTRRIPFVFSGKGFDYFKIWLVNLLVTILSAGILLPWAKVRSMRYFYQHTHLDSIEFQCKANPQKIYLVQFLFVAYLCALIFGFFYSSFYFAIGLLALVAILPVYWFKYSLFEHKHSLYRDIAFRKEASLQEAYKFALAWPLVIVLSAGLLAPYALFKMQQYRIQKKYLGTYEFIFSAESKQYLVLLAPILIAECLIFICLHWKAHLPFYFSAAFIAVVLLFAFIRCQVILVNFQWNGISSKLGYFVSTWKLQSYSKLVLQNVFLCILTLGLYWPWAKVRVAKYKANHLAFFGNQRFKKWQSGLDLNIAEKIYL